MRITWPSGEKCFSTTSSMPMSFRAIPGLVPTCILRPHAFAAPLRGADVILVPSSPGFHPGLFSSAPPGANLVHQKGSFRSLLRRTRQGHRSGGVALEQGAIFQVAQNLVGPGDDFLSDLQPRKNLDVGASGDSGAYGNEPGAKAAMRVFLRDEYALHGLGVGAFDASRLHAVLAVGGVNGGVVNGERLDRQREDAVFVGGRDFGGARKAWTKLAGGAVERDHDFEILRFFGAGGGLGGGNAGGAEQRLVADKCDVTLENFIGQGIHS